MITKNLKKVLLVLLLSGFYMAGFGQINLENGLIAYYAFNGNAEDITGNGNNGTVYGAVLTTDRFGNTNSAYSFDGVDDFIEIIPDSDAVFNDFSISIWAYMIDYEEQPGAVVATLDRQYLFDGHTHSSTVTDDFYREGFAVFQDLNYDYTTTLNGYINKNDTSYYNRFDTDITGAWHNIVYTRRGNLTKLYLDGILVNTQEATGSVLDMRHTWYIGTFSGNNPYYNDANYNFHGILDDIRIYNRELSNDEVVALSSYSIETDGNYGQLGNYVDIPVIEHCTLTTDDGIYSYQFRYNFDGSKLEYVGYDLNNLITEGGNVQVNVIDSGQLFIGWTRTSPLVGSGDLIHLRFKCVGLGNSDLIITNFKYNETDITNVTNGDIMIIPHWGDVTANGEVTAYDAALTLMYSVGVDPMPAEAPLPWDDWRIVTADVDGSGDITAIDASLILQYAVGLISSFPVENSKKDLIPDADVEVAIIGNNIVFTSKGDILGFNMSVKNSSGFAFGTPLLADNTLLNASQITENSYNFGLCGAVPLENNTQFLKIPYAGDLNNDLTIDMVINNTKKTIVLNTGTTELNSAKILLYPNPATDKIEVISPILQDNSKIEIYTISGKLIFNTSVLNGNIVDITNLSPGVYVLKIKGENQNIVSKFIKE